LYIQVDSTFKLFQQVDSTFKLIQHSSWFNNAMPRYFPEVHGLPYTGYTI